MVINNLILNNKNNNNLIIYGFVNYENKDGIASKIFTFFICLGIINQGHQPNHGSETIKKRMVMIADLLSSLYHNK